MSAWTVTQTHISTLVSAAMRFEVPYNGEPVNLLNATAIGQDLWNVNYQSVNYRYSEHEPTPEYTFSPVDMDAAAIFKQVGCYAYQSCEDPTWTSTAAYAFTEALESEIVQSLNLTPERITKTSAYEQAPWGVDDVQPEYIPDTVTVATMEPEPLEPVSLPEWRLRQMRESEHSIRDCEGCKSPLFAADKFCGHCGCDLNDLYGRILGTSFESVTPFNADPKWTYQGKAAMAKDVRAWFKTMGWTGATAKVTSRGVYSCSVDIYLPAAHPLKANPANEWDREECDHDRIQFGHNGNDCAKCARRWAALRHLEHLCYAAFPAAYNHTDSQSDYFSQTFGIA